MQNAVPDTASTLAARTLARRSTAYADEIQRLITAGFDVMRRTGSLDPKVSDIVRRARLSNQAFYRHFASKDELLLAMLDAGQQQLVAYLETRVRAAPPGVRQVRRWIEGVMEQARNEDAAARTRPFVLNAARLAEQFPEEAVHSREQLLAPLRAAVAASGGDPNRDADAIYHLAMGSMHDALTRRVTPTRSDVDHLVRFALGGLGTSDE